MVGNPNAQPDIFVMRSATVEELLQAAEALAARVDALEAKKNDELGNSDTVKRVLADCSALPLRSARLKRVPEDYYSHTLEQRRDFLEAPTIDHLCKSILLENTSCTEKDCSDPTNARYYIVIIQYTAKLHSHKVFGFVRSLKQLSRKSYHFRLADESESGDLTGFEHNAMCPVGLSQKDIPIILDEKITKLTPNFFWAGGGEVDLKLGVSVEEFCANVPLLYVADVTH